MENIKSLAIKGFLLIILICLAFAPVARTEEVSSDKEISLTEAILLSLENRSEVKQANLQLQRAKLQLSAANSDSSLPSIDLGIGSPKLTDKGLNGNLTGTATAELSLPYMTSSNISAELDSSLTTSGEMDHSWSINLSGTLDVAETNKVKNTIEEKREAVSQAESELQDTKQTTITTTVEQFKKLIQQKRELEQARDDLKDAEDNLNKIKDLVEEGIKGEMDLQEAKVELMDSRISVEEKKSTFTTAKERFGRIFLNIEEDFTPLTPNISLDKLKNAATTLLQDQEKIKKAVEGNSRVKQAIDNVNDAEEELARKQKEVSPSFGFQAGVNSEGVSAGINLSFDLFTPSRTDDIEIAETNVSLAKEQLRATRESVKEGILSGRSSLQQALNKLEKLPTEKEKWTTEEKVKKSKYEAGSLSENDWREFQEELEKFQIDAQSREFNLLQNYLEYRNKLGFELDWKEWLE